MKAAPKKRAGRGPVRGRSRRWLWLSFFALLLVGGVLVAAATTSPAEALAAERTFHDFSQIGINDGLVVVKFPLTVKQATQVTDVQTS